MKYIYILVMVLILGCKPDSKTGDLNTGKMRSNTNTSIKTGNSDGARISESTDKAIKDIANQKPKLEKNRQSRFTNYNVERIPDGCNLLSAKTIAKYVKVPENSININDGSSSKNLFSRACFFKWDGDALKNAGVMISVGKNPVADEVPNYISFFIDSKINDGEKDFRNDLIYKFKKWDNVGDAGAYNADLGKYLWRIGEEWTFMVAFNTTTIDEKEQMVAANAFAKEVMKNMKKVK